MYEVESLEIESLAIYETTHEQSPLVTVYVVSI
jgi:hypothetical protein